MSKPLSAGLLFLLASCAAGQYGYAPPANLAPLGNGSPIVPGYGMRYPYPNVPPRVVPNQVQNYSSAVPYDPGYGDLYYQPPFASALQGYASLASATGQYWGDIGSARITREQANQAALDTRRKQIEFERWYEHTRPTALTMAARRKASTLEWARHDAQQTQIWDGRPLNVLLQSILMASDPSAGPKIYLDPSTVRGLNLTLTSTRGNLALAKNGGRIDWTETLQSPSFDDDRNRFSQNFVKAIKIALAGNAPPLPLIRDLRADLKGLGATLDDQVQDITPTAYIDSRRLLNQLKSTIEGLGSPLLCQACGDAWKKTIHTVADVVKYCMDNGMRFGPAAAPGDYSAYTAFYHALRNYERGLWQAPAG